MEQVNVEEIRKRLSELSMQDVKEIDTGTLTELKDLSIDKDLPVRERVLSLIRQTGNPYAYLMNGTVVKISFSGSGRTLQDCMEDYLLSELLPDA